MMLSEREFMLIPSEDRKSLLIRGYREVKGYEALYLKDDLKLHLDSIKDRLGKLASDVAKIEQRGEYVDAYNALLNYLNKIIVEELGI